MRGTATAALVLVAGAGLGCRPPSFTPRHVPIRWIELHAPRHPECQVPVTNRTGLVPTAHPSAWRTSELIHWIVSRMNEVSTGGGQFQYLGNHVRLGVALRDSPLFLTTVGEFDHAAFPTGRLGDDLILLRIGSP